MNQSQILSSVLLSIIKKYNIKHVFTVPGDYNLPLCEAIQASNVQLIQHCNELNAGYAADAYARLHGIAVLLTTYGVGALSTVNALAGSYAENVAVVHIACGPNQDDYRYNRKRHHISNHYDVPLNVFSEITKLSHRLNSTKSANNDMEQVFYDAHQYKKPVYLEIPQDLITQYIATDITKPMPNPMYQPSTINSSEPEHALLLEHMNRAHKPLLIIGHEVARWQMKHACIDLIEKYKLPFTGLMADKGILPETHRYFINKSHCHEQHYDLAILIGVELFDLHQADYEQHININNTVMYSEGKVYINKQCLIKHISLHDFLVLLNTKVNWPDFMAIPLLKQSPKQHVKTFSLQSFFQRIESWIRKDDIIISDLGTVFFEIQTISFPSEILFLNQGNYGSIGYSLPAALGAGLTHPGRRVVVFSGDGAAQMSMQAISSLIRYNINVVIFLINNKGYTIERLIMDGAFNDLQNWQWSKCPNIFGGNTGHYVDSEQSLDIALNKAQHANFTLVELSLDKMDSGTEMLKFFGENVWAA